MNRSLCSLAVGLTLILPFTGCRRQEGTAAEEPGAGDGREFSVLLNWFAEAEHGGYYAAEAEGLFAAEGLSVRILPGGPGASVVQRIATGEVDFGVENADHVLLARAQGVPVVAVFAPIQTHPRCIMVHESTGITRLEDLRGLTLAMNPSGSFSHFLRKRVPLTDVRIVPYGGSVSPFLADESYAQQAYAFSEPFVAEQAGARPRVLLLSELGFNPYTSCLLTSEETIRERPDAVRRLVRACARGWAGYVADPTPAHRLILEANPEMSPAALDYGARSLVPLIHGDDQDAGIGRMTAERWRQLLNQLEETELLEPGSVDPREAFTTEFLPGTVAE